MTRGKKIVAKLGPVLVYKGGYMMNDENLAKYNKRDHLIEFLNVDCSNDEAVNKYCRETAYIPKDQSEGWVTAFHKEQADTRAVTEKIAKNQIDDTVIEKIVSHLEDMPIRYKALTEKELAELNKDLYWVNSREPLEPTKSPKSERTKKHLVIVSHYLCSQHKIWTNLLSQIIQKIPIRQCGDMRRCRRFFIPDRYHPDQNFCSPECEDRVSKRDDYSQKKQTLQK